MDNPRVAPAFDLRFRELAGRRPVVRNGDASDRAQLVLRYGDWVVVIDTIVRVSGVKRPAVAAAAINRSKAMLVS
jgi:hypothetical protein